MLEQSQKKVYSIATTKSIPMLKPEHEFCQQNGPEPVQLQEWYPDEIMVVVPVCLNAWGLGAWVMYCVNKDVDKESLLFLVF